MASYDYDYEYSKEKFIKYSVALFFLVFASGFIVGSGFQFYNRQSIYRNGIHTTGIVTDIEHATNTDMDVYVFKVKFSFDNQDYLIENENKTGNEDRYQLNEKLRVGFISSAPEKAIIDDHREHEYTLGLLLPQSIGFLALYFAFLAVKSIKKPTQQKQEIPYK